MKRSGRGEIEMLQQFFVNIKACKYVLVDTQNNKGILNIVYRK